MNKMSRVSIGFLFFVLFSWGCSENSTEPYSSKSPGALNCPDTPNCVSSLAKNPKHRVKPFILLKDPKSGWEIVQKTVESLPRTKIISADGSRIHAEIRSMVFRFVDDLILQLIPSDNMIHIRSASRTGYSDFGVNRRRVERIRKILQHKGIIQ